MTEATAQPPMSLNGALAFVKKSLEASDETVELVGEHIVPFIQQGLKQIEELPPSDRPVKWGEALAELVVRLNRSLPNIEERDTLERSASYLRAPDPAVVKAGWRDFLRRLICPCNPFC